MTLPRPPSIGSTGWLASPVRNLIAGLVYLALVMAGATVSYVAAGWSLGDAFYMVIVTVYTVGYGEVRPIDTTLLRAITVSTIVLGCTGVIFLTGALVQLITLNQLNQVFGTKRMTQQIDQLTGHIVICGFGRIGLQLAQELRAGRAEFVIMDSSESVIEQARALGYLCLQADATDEAALIAAGVLRARTLATVLANDALNVFITLSARRLNPALEIIARGEATSTESLLLQAGANRVVLPTHIGAERVAELILFPDTARLLRDTEPMRGLDRALSGLGLTLDVVIAPAGCPAIGQTVEALEQAAHGEFFIVQIDRADTSPIARPPPDTRVAAGDGLLLIGRTLTGLALFEPGAPGFRVSAR